ncbi:uncharacterized protein [Littorina saxatilis]|uniref:uncharacterized protein n=1 Tax=Littorina saxatilis TaxID=31220 RepID=UPI0038B57656
MTVVMMGSHHQGEDIFSPDTRGRQCTAMATSAAAFIKVKDIATWEKPDLTLIMLFGDLLYKTIMEARPTNEFGYLLISDIPDNIDLFNKKFTFNRGQSLCGVVSDRQLSEAAVGLDAALRKALQDYGTALVVLKQSSVMIHQDQHGRWFLFDSHARNMKGMPSARGKSILITFTDFVELVAYLNRLSAELSKDLLIFEVAGVNIADCSPADFESSTTAGLGSSTTAGLGSSTTAGFGSSTTATSDLCIICGEDFEYSRADEVWIQCNTCRRWCHEDCADIGTTAYYRCDFCR